ncbi:MAG: DUF5723 family protein [Bacteroidota bacterium]
MNSVNEKRHFTSLMIAAVLGVVIANTSNAGNDLFSGRTVGMARTFTASSRGLDAIGLNPANLALDDRGSSVTFEVAPFMGIGVLAGSDFLNYKIYQDDFTGVDSLDANGKPTGVRIPKVLSQSDKDEILGLFPGGISHTQVNFAVTEFGFTAEGSALGGIGFSVSDQVGVNLDLPEGYLKMLLDAFPATGATYTLDNTSIKASWLRYYNLSYARMLPIDLKWMKDVAVGVGVKYVQGFGYTGTDHYTGSIQIVPTTSGSTILSEPTSGNVSFLQRESSANFVSIDTGNVSFNGASPSDFLSKPAGTGLGLDLGLSGEVFQAFRVGVSVTDIGNVTWNQNTKVIVENGSFSISDINQQDSLKNAFKGQTIDTSSFKTSLPTALHIGGAFQVDKAAFISYFPGQLLVAADFNVGFNNEPGNSTIPRISVGTEYRPIGAFPIRTGISFGGRDGFFWSVGLGINTPVWDLDFGTESISLITNPNSFRDASFALGMRFRL